MSGTETVSAAVHAEQGFVGGDVPLVYRLGRATTAMVLLTLLASIVNYSSSIVFSHLLAPAAFGDLTALFTLSVVVAVPAVAAQTVIADRLATLVAQGAHERASRLIRHAAGHVGVAAVGVAVVYLACLPLVETALKLQNLGSAVSLAPLLALSFFVPLAYGVLQGFDRFVALGSVALAIALSRIVIGVPWTLAGGGASAPILGQTIGSVLALGVVAWIVRDHMIGRGTGALRSGVRRRVDRRSVSAIAAFVAFAVLSNLDLLLAKVFLSATAGGLYAALATAEKIVIFLPGAVSAVMVPSAARARLAEGTDAHVLRVAAALVIGTTLIVALPMALFPHLVLQTMFGSKYTSVTSGVVPIVWAGGALALLYLLVVYTVAIGDRRWVRLLVGGLGAQVVALLAFHSSPTQIATVQAIVVTALLIVNELFFYPVLRRR